MSLVVHPLIHSNIRDPYFWDVHHLKGTKERWNCLLPLWQRRSCSSLSRKKRQSCLFSWRRPAILDTVFLQDTFSQIKSHIHNFNLTDRDDYFCCPQDVLNTTVAIPEPGKHQQARGAHKLIKTLIFHLWFCLVPLPPTNKLVLFTSSK